MTERVPVSTVELSAGTIEYVDTGGEGPVLVLLHGVLMDDTLWSAVVADLSADHRCVVPTLPLGGHRRPVLADADLSLPGVAGLVAELLERLDVHDVTLVGNDTGGALVQLVLRDRPARVGAVVLTSCEAFDNLPPGLTGKTLAAAGRLSPTLFGLVMQQLRLRPLRRLPVTFGRLTKRGDPVVAGWLRPVWTSAEIRRDTVRMLRALTADRNLLVEAASRLPAFEGPALVVWAAEDRVMPPEHGGRLATLFADGRLVEIQDSYTLIPLDQPAELTRQIRQFVAGNIDTPLTGRTAPPGSSDDHS